MKLTLTTPTDSALNTFLASATGPLSYPEVGATRDAAHVPGYDNDFHKVCLGEGAEVFQSACDTLTHWEHFPKHWVKIGSCCPPLARSLQKRFVKDSFLALSFSTRR